MKAWRSTSGETLLLSDEKTVALFCVVPSNISREINSARRALSL
jgi:hypothetical protein